ncbi:hypothetical protein O9H85_04900 [Paenibacillus filicis]|uniref:YfhD family protein n=1 Tax=Paenibacillus gyeongsangnamensis TaxID=3388067 RepID=A0ABT4Q4H2_9BACL|nr:hypothetical protein [Paenibacillus filicis]MCZ8511770.1 hypothetical protein [Paenibacillus filicis]
MADSKNQASKAEVQTTKLNRITDSTVDDTEFSAEEAAEVFKANPTSARKADKQE